MPLQCSCLVDKKACDPRNHMLLIKLLSVTMLSYRQVSFIKQLVFLQSCVVDKIADPRNACSQSCVVEKTACVLQCFLAIMRC